MLTNLKNALLCATILGAAAPAYAAIPKPPTPTLLVTGAIDESKTTPLTADLSAAVARSTDKGAVSPATALPHIKLVLKRPAALQAALDDLTRNQHVRGSAEFRQWITPAELRAYGPAKADVEKVAAWLRSHGLTVHEISPAGMWIDFGGTAAQVSAAFHTSLHNVMLGTEAHMANMTPPAIPAALAPVVTGVTLHNFFPRPMLHKAIPGYTKNTPYGTFYAVGAQDFATIYGIAPLRTSNNAYGAPITGSGVTLAVVEETMMKQQDWKKFRTVFGLSGYAGTLAMTHPHGCTSPGFTGDETEAAIDAEWSSAVAPDADIIEASCAGTAPYEFGVLTTLTNMVEKGTTATIFSISYGGNEADNGYAFEQAWVNELQAGAAEGIAIFVSTGDSGVSTSEGGIAGQGLFVNGLADSAYNVAVGGTDFYDTALGENSTYWKKSNTPSGLSAKSYIPEIPWDNSCSNSVIWNYNGGTSAMQFCNTAFDGPLQNGVGGSGSQSVYFTKPDWQLTSVPGMPNDGVRDQPDVALFAANGIWNHFYLECMSDANEGGVPCNYNNSTYFLDSAYGGTSFAAPDFAGIAALLQEVEGGKLGNPAPEFYTIAQAQYTTPLGLSQCNASLGNKISTACVFNNITTSDNSEPCVAGTLDCASSKMSTMGIGVLKATIGGKSIIAYPGQPGYSLATGLGSVNVANLLYSYY